MVLLDEPGLSNREGAAVTDDGDYDLFLSTPMSGLRDEQEYRSHRQFVLEVAEVLCKDLGVERIYFAGREVTSIQGFDAGDDALRSDLEALRESRVLCLVYPRRLVSSVLIEVGMALALGKPCLLFVRRREDLPYLLISAEKLAGRDGLPVVRIVEYQNPEDLKRLLREAGAKLFDTLLAEPSHSKDGVSSSAR